MGRKKKPETNEILDSQSMGEDLTRESQLWEWFVSKLLSLTILSKSKLIPNSEPFNCVYLKINEQYEPVWITLIDRLTRYANLDISKKYWVTLIEGKPVFCSTWRVGYFGKFNVNEQAMAQQLKEEVVSNIIVGMGNKIVETVKLPFYNEDALKKRSGRVEEFKGR